MSLPTFKAALRDDALRRRAELPDPMRVALTQRLAQDGLDVVQRFGTSATASAFLPIGTEPDTLPLIAALTRAGIVMTLPVTVGRAMPLRFLAWRPGEPLIAGRYGIDVPAPTAPACDPDVLFVPLVAFDARGCRLGYGAGYYDATLSALRRSKPVLAIGVAFAAQEVEAVPTEPHDERLDAVLTERGLLSFGSR